MNDTIPPSAASPKIPAFDERSAKALVAMHHSAFLGVEFSAMGANWAELALPWRKDLVGDADSGVLASGPIISLLDAAAALAVWNARGGLLPQVTLDLRVDYLRAARPGETVVGHCECYALKRSTAFTRGIAHDGDAADPLAHMTAVFALRTSM